VGFSKIIVALPLNFLELDKLFYSDLIQIARKITIKKEVCHENEKSNDFSGFGCSSGTRLCL
jgi:hypothetical protein